MKNPITTIYNASKKVLKEKLITFLLITIGMFAIFLLIPVISIPGNSIPFQFSIWKVKDYLVLIPMSLLISLLFTMQLYAFKLKKAGKCVVGGYSGVVAGVFGTASCASCVAAIFGFLGAGAVFTLIQYQWYVVSIALALVLVSLFLAARDI